MPLFKRGINLLTGEQDGNDNHGNPLALTDPPRYMESFQQLYDPNLSALPGVQRLTSTAVMKTVVQNRAVVP